MESGITDTAVPADSNKKRQNSNSEVSDSKKPRQRTMSGYTTVLKTDDTASGNKAEMEGIDELDDSDDVSIAGTLKVILEKLSALSEIKASITDIQSDVHDLKQSLAASDKDIRDLEGRCDALDSRLKEIEKNTDTIYMLREENTYLRKKVEDLEAYSRRDNLLFEGFTENKNENCEDLLHMIFIKTLNIQDSRTRIKFTRVHRIGRKSKDTPRPILARFHYYPDRDMIWNKRKMFKGTAIIVKEDLPNHVESRRRAMWPVVKAAREKGFKVTQIADRLRIDGRIYTLETLDSLPAKIGARELGQKVTEDYVLFSGRLSVFSNFHPSMFQIGGVTYSCNEQYYQWQKARQANDPVSASKILLSRDPSEMKAIGDKVALDPNVWQPRVFKEIMLQGLEAKFSQNPMMKRALLATGDKVLVECSKYDGRWGNGLSLLDPNSADNSQWKGDNLLGECLKEIKSKLSKI